MLFNKYERALKKYWKILEKNASLRLERKLSRDERSRLRSIDSLMTLELIEPIISFAPIAEVLDLLKTLPSVQPKEPSTDETSIICATCGKKLAEWNSQTENHQPTPAELNTTGHVAIPNFGWFCGQICGGVHSRLVAK